MVYKLIYIFLILWITRTGAQAQVPGFFMKEEKRKVTIPFYSSNNLIILPVSVNGSYPVNFLVDTGVRSNILFSKNLGDAMGLEYSRSINLMGADASEKLMASVSPFNRLDLGPVEGVLQSLLVLEEDFLELESVIGVPIYGIIGYEFFKFNAVKINYDDGKIDFYRSNALKWAPPFYEKLKLTIEQEKPYVQASILQKEGKTLNSKLLIDTGANHGLLLNRETSSEITLPPLFIESELGQSLGGILYGYVGRVASLKLGRIKFRKVLTSYPEKTAFSHIIFETGRLGSLGSEVLGRMQLILDYPRGRAMMKKGDHFHAPFQFDMSGIVVRKIPTDETRFYIGMVRPGSPAQKAGILPFDEILTVNKIPAILWDLSDLIKLLKSEEGKEIEFELRRYFDDSLTRYEDLKLKIVLKRQI